MNDGSYRDANGVQIFPDSGVPTNLVHHNTRFFGELRL